MPTYEFKDGSKLVTPTVKPGLERSKACKRVEDDKAKPATKPAKSS